jgi:hypothetical protein
MGSGRQRGREAAREGRKERERQGQKGEEERERERGGEREREYFGESMWAGGGGRRATIMASYGASGMSASRAHPVTHQAAVL